MKLEDDELRAYEIIAGFLLLIGFVLSRLQEETMGYIIAFIVGGLLGFLVAALLSAGGTE